MTTYLTALVSGNPANVDTSFVPGWAMGLLLVMLVVAVMAWAFTASPYDQPLDYEPIETEDERRERKARTAESLAYLATVQDNLRGEAHRRLRELDGLLSTMESAPDRTPERIERDQARRDKWRWTCKRWGYEPDA